MLLDLRLAWLALSHKLEEAPGATLLPGKLMAASGTGRNRYGLILIRRSGWQALA